MPLLPMMSVQLSAGSVMVLITAPLAGMGFLAARMLGRSGRAKLTYATLARSKADVAVIVVYDVVGAIIAAATFVLLGVTKPAVLVAYFKSDPWIAWSAFGIMGPLFAVGILDRLPILRLVSASLEPGYPVAQSGERRVRSILVDGSAVRRTSVERILKCQYEDVLVTEDSERNSIYHRAKRLIDAQSLHFDDIAPQVARYVDEFRDGNMPDEVANVIQSRKAWPTDYDAFKGADTLVGVALDQGLNRPINIACRIAENNASDESGFSSVGMGL